MKRSALSVIVVAAMLSSAPAQLPTEHPSSILERYGPRADRSIDRALDFIAARQLPNGSFEGTQGNTSAVVGLCGMAFLAQGHVPGHGKYGHTLNRCVDRLIRSQSKTGYLAKPRGRPMYSHLAGTLFLLEASGMVDATRQAKLDALLPKAVNIVVAAQKVPKPAKFKGGWRYHPGSGDSDLSCSGWGVMVLRAARMNGMRVPDQAIDDAIAYVRRHELGRRGRFVYQAPGKRGSVTLTGVALTCILLAGYDDDALMRRASAFMLSEYEKIPSLGHPYYGLYYASQAMYHMGGKAWETFAPWMYDYWISRQHPKTGGWIHPYQTAMVVLSFSLPYQQLPIYQRDIRPLRPASNDP